MTENKNRNYADAIVERGEAFHVVVFDEDLRTVQQVLVGLYIRHTTKEAGSGITDITFGSGETMGRVHTALLRWAELNAPGA